MGEHVDGHALLHDHAVSVAQPPTSSEAAVVTARDCKIRVLMASTLVSGGGRGETSLLPPPRRCGYRGQRSEVRETPSKAFPSVLDGGILEQPGGVPRRRLVRRSREKSVMTVASPGGRTGSFVHLAVFYDGVEDLSAAVVPFIREGIDSGEPVLVALVRPHLARVRSALGPDASRVAFVDMGEVGANPARIIPEWRRFLEETGDGPVRGVGEPVWSGRRGVEIEEAVLHEALLNLAFEGGRAWQLMCPYDASALPSDVIDEARRSHPELRRGEVAAAGRVPNAYVGTEAASAAFRQPLAPAPQDADAWDFSGPDLAGIRSLVERAATSAGVTRDRADDLVLAAHELASNSVLHAGGHGTLCSWSDPEAFVLEIRDTGVIADPLVGRDLLDDLAEGGRGVWMANQLCDLVQVRSSAAGTVVRLFSWLNPEAAPAH
jgi:anti-sigma regulatory factor (Ser/Thr protein kinase)